MLFEKFYKGEWQKTKHCIRRDVFKALRDSRKKKAITEEKQDAMKKEKGTSQSDRPVSKAPVLENAESIVNDQIKNVVDVQPSTNDTDTSISTAPSVVETNKNTSDNQQ